MAAGPDDLDRATPPGTNHPGAIEEAPVFVLSKLLWALLRPTAALILLSLAGLILTWIGRGRLGAGLMTVGIVGLVAIVLLPVDAWVLRPLEERFPQIPSPAHVDGVIVLGGALDQLLTEDRGIPSLNSAAERLTTFVAMARRYPDARLVFTGGAGELFPGATVEADGVRTLLESLGLSPSRVVFERASRTTYDNAVMSRALVEPHDGETWLLITSASHMPRAVGVFRQAGWEILAWPVGYKTYHTGEPWLSLNLGEKIAGFDWGVHEWIGLITYRLLGRTNALFPSPDE